ncbi:MAG: GNAT family N-acetyltransferase [Flavobacteriales bacterium]
MIKIDEEYTLTEFELTDTHRLAYAIGDEEIAKNTLTIPHPYRIEDAEWWLTERGIRKNAGMPQTNWAIRNSKGEVCGGIAIHHKYGPKSHKDEIGYWLMRPLWGQGLMTKVVSKLSDYCFQELGLIRLEAPIFEHNKGSARVLEKSGYQLEGKFRKAYRKKGVFYNSHFYAKIAEQSD